MEIFIPITFFVAIAAIFILPNYFKSRERMAMQDTLRAAYQAGQPVHPEVIDALTRGVKPIGSPIRDIRGGIIWLAVAAGFVGFAYAVSYEADEAFYPVLGLASVPAVVGVALVLMGLLGLATEKKSKS